MYFSQLQIFYVAMYFFFMGAAHPVATTTPAIVAPVVQTTTDATKTYLTPNGTTIDWFGNIIATPAFGLSTQSTSTVDAFCADEANASLPEYDRCG